jgi:hypothetical protein
MLLLTAGAWFVLAPSLRGVKVSFLRMERVYTEHEFTDVALFSFTNVSPLEVSVFGGRVLPAQRTLRGMPFCVHDYDTTNQLMFRTVREIQLKPKKGEVIAVPAAHGSTNWVVELNYSYEGFRNKLAYWLGPTKGGILVPPTLRRVKIESYQSAAMPFLPEELTIRSPRPNIGLTLSGPHSGISSSVRFMALTNGPALKRP